MRINTALAAVLLLAGSLFQIPAHAEGEPQAQLQLIVVDEANTALPNAAVTVYSVDGNPGRDLTTDRNGVVVVPALPARYAQIYARYPGRTPYIEGTTLKPGANVIRVMLPARQSETE